MDEQRAVRLWVQKQFKTSGFQLEVGALDGLIRAVQHVDDPEEYVHSLIEEIEAGESQLTTRRAGGGGAGGATSNGRLVSAALLEQAAASLEGRRQRRDVVQVIDAFQVPYIIYDPLRKLFHASADRRNLLADAKSKLQLYINRYHLVHQRLRRNRLFRPPQWGGLGRGGAAPECELTELKALLGLVGETRFVVGFLTQPEEGRFALEDLSARLPVDVSAAEQTHGLFTQNCVVVAEGELTPGGVLRLAALGMPPLERREESAAALQGLDFFGGRQPEERDATHAEDRVVLLSDVWLDRPDVLDKLQAVFAGFSQLEQPPSLFVLLGSFQSYDANTDAAHYGRLREQFGALGRLIASFPALRSGSRFVLAPGPGDLGPGASLPRPPLPRALAADLLAAVPGAVLASNPCRIRHGASQLVAFRDDLQQRMRGLAILPPAPPAPGEDEVPLFEHVCATVLQQSHLCPVPLEYQPIYWEHDHALYLYPLPDALVLADAAPAAAHVFDTCSCLNPGSLVDGTFGAYNPISQEVEVCDVAPAEVEEEEEDLELEVEGEAAAVEDGGGSDMLEEAALGGAHKRRAVPPGFLGSQAQAFQRMSSVGLTEGLRAHLRPTRSGAAAAPSTSSSSSCGSAAAPAASSGATSAAAYVPVRTLPLLFAHRKRFLQRHKAQAQFADEYQQRPGREGLLALPEDVLLKIICHLKHDEVAPLFSVCKQLRQTLKAAVSFYFDFSTPSRASAQGGPPVPRPDRHRRRAVVNLADVIRKHRDSRGARMAAAGRGAGSPAAAALRALSFPDPLPA
eukprot:scaffold2.g7226.t1